MLRKLAGTLGVVATVGIVAVAQGQSDCSYTLAVYDDCSGKVYCTNSPGSNCVTCPAPADQ